MAVLVVVDASVIPGHSRNQCFLARRLIKIPKIIEEMKRLPKQPDHFARVLLFRLQLLQLDVFGDGDPVDVVEIGSAKLAQG